MNAKEGRRHCFGCLILLIMILVIWAGVATGAGLLSPVAGFMVALVGSAAVVTAVPAAMGDGRGPREGN